MCEKSFKDKSSLKRHQPVHGGVARKQLECGVCNKEFSDRSTFLRHQRELHPPSAADEEDDDADDDENNSRSSKKPSKKAPKRKDTSAALAFGCNICKKSFKRRITMATHVSRVHGIPVERPGSKKDPSDGRQPIEKFLMKKPPGAVAVGGGLPEEKKPWSSVKCPQCDMIFCKRSAMEVHLRTHTGDKPYFCDVSIN